jgi:RNA polymerase sigma-70 factor (TIGR02960 family)
VRVSSTTTNEDLIHAARDGDEGAYRRLVEPHRPLLHAHCYRMLGSLSDAEDALQEALVGAWQGFARFEGRSSLRTWLFTIATHACLRASSKRPRRVLPDDRAPAADPRADLPDALEEALWVEPYPDARLGLEAESMPPDAKYEQLESVEIAFVAALQYLPGTQRAVLILRDVLGFSAEETATALDTSVVSANSALQRARDTIAHRLPAESQRVTRRALGDPLHRDLVDRFIDAWQRTDVDAIVAMLADDATFTMPPLPAWFRGREDIRIFLVANVFKLRWRFVRTHASGQPTMAAYVWKAEACRFELDVLNVIDFRGERVSAITAFPNPELCRRFGLDPELRE